MYKDCSLYINGEWVPAQSGDTLDVHDPATDEVVGKISSAGEADLDRALEAAEAGLAEWRETGTWDRAAKLRKVADLIRENVEEIATTMSIETGKPVAEARGETGAAADQFEWYSEETKRIYGQLIGSRTSDSRLSVIYQPVGVVAAFTAWNFPALLPARKIGAALAAGCSIIIKPAGETPGSCALLVQACHDAGIPKGVVNFVTGSSRLISKHLVSSPIVRKVSLTGSVPVGQEILHLAADGIKKVTMELGGHGPVVVFEDADPVEAAKVCAGAKFRNCGQVCISPTRFYVHESNYDAFAGAFVEVAQSLKIGRGMDDGVTMGPMANKRGLEHIKGLVEDAVSQGAEVLHGGAAPSEFNRGNFFEPTVLGNVSDDARIMVEEPFGPVAPITRFRTYDEVMTRANSLEFGLAGYLFTRDLGLATRASEDLEVGMVGVNEMLLATAEAPFGGIKASGMGREGGSQGIQDYLEPKYIKMKILGCAVSEKKTGLANGLTNYGDPDFAVYLRKSFARSMGYSNEMLERPVVGIAYTASGFNNCHRHFPEMLEAVKRGVLTSGGLPLDFPTTSLGEVFLSPTSLKFRNLMSMDTEEMIRAQPMDSVVLMGGCDKTVPAQLMGAASADIPAVQLVGGPMMTSRHGEERLGACTDCRRFWGKYRAGEISSAEINEVEGKLATTAGTCAVMGTASTMACIAEALGMSLPGTAAIPAVHADRLRAAELSGVVATNLVHNPIRPSEVITKKSVENALRVLLALGGSTNAIIHLTAVAGRCGIDIPLTWLNELSDTTPVLVNLKPVGNHYMEDFFAAGGLGAVLRELKPLLNLDCVSVTGETLEERLSGEIEYVDREVVAEAKAPLEPVGGLVALFGSLAPNGAILKRSAADKNLFEKEGRAIVFSSLEDLSKRIDDPELDVNADDFLVLQNAGPTSDSGMPEAGYLPIPKKLAQQGVKDMVRISDARMSGTAFGTIVLHVSPEAAIGGPLALVETGDRIRLSVENRVIDLLVDEAELARRKSELPEQKSLDAYRGYDKLYREQVLQAEEGCDFSILLPVTKT